VSNPKAPPPLDLDAADVPAFLARGKDAMSDDDYQLLQAMVSTLLYVTDLVAKGKASLRRLTKLLFGARTEKACDVLPKTEPTTQPTGPSEDAPAKKPKGHGRNGAEDYPGATRIPVAHLSLRPGDACPEGCPGKLYRRKDPMQLVRFRGNAPLDASVYDLEQLRCTLCGKVYTAAAPEGVGDEKYDASAASMLAVLRYGSGLPLHRVERLQANLGVPLPSSTQWDILDDAADPLEPALEELIRQGAQADLVYNDDTPMKILALMGKRAEKSRASKAKDGAKKRAVFTSGLVLIREGVKIVLFLTGPKHAGENLADVLSRRATELPSPTQMCDALSRNVPKLPKGFETVLANCLAHGRRQFVDVVACFPDQCRSVIEILAKVYRNDEIAQEQGMSPAERLAFHQAESQPLMENLHAWFLEQRDGKKAEPNSGLGQAIAYMLKHWLKLTLFLRVPGAPLDNNICERALKKAILHRKNSLFYKTQHGAHVGDLFMSLIHTCESNAVNPLTYLTELLRHTAELRATPAAWMPWNYADTLRHTAAPRVASPPHEAVSLDTLAGAPCRQPPRSNLERPTSSATCSRPLQHARAPAAPAY
jgi:transposase